MDQRKSGTFPGDIPATASYVASKRIEWCIQYHRPESEKPYDGLIPTELFDEMVQAPLATNAIFGATAPTLGNATMRCYVDTLPGPKQGFDVPTSYRIFDQPFAALNAQVLVPGALEHVALFTTAANSRNRLTSANIASITTRADGKPLLINSRLEDAASLWNRHQAITSLRGSSSPVYNQPAESIDDQPDQSNGAAQASSQVEFCPLVFPSRTYTEDKLAKVKNGLAVDLAGTIGAYTIACRIREERDVGHGQRAARKAGAAAGTIHATTGHADNLGFAKLAVR